MHSSRSRRRLATAVAAVATLGLLGLGGCATGGSPAADSTSGAGSAHPSTTITVQMQQDPGSLDPVAGHSISLGYLSEYLYEGLFAMDAHHRPQPMAAKSFTLSDDKRTYTITLRRDRKFSDGSPVTANDVVASLKYWMKGATFGQELAKVVTSVSAPSKDTVVIALSKPYPVPTMIAFSIGTGAVIYPARVLKGVTAKGLPKDKIIGSGPYKLKSWTAGQEIVLTRNEHYTAVPEAASGYAGAKHAYPRDIVFKVVADPDAARNGLLTGQWQVYTTPTPEQYGQLTSNKNVSVSALKESGRTTVLYLNHSEHSVFHNAAARDALNTALDKKAISAAAAVPDLTTNTGAWATPENKEIYSTAGKATYDAHDPQKARSQFSHVSGLDKPVRIVRTSENPVFPRIATLVQDQLKKVGVKATVGSYDFGTLIGMVKDYKWDILVLDDSNDYPLPGLNPILMGLLTYEQAPGGYDSPQMDGLFTDYQEATSDAQRRRLADKIQARFAKDKPAIVLYQVADYIAYSSKLKGYDHWDTNFWNSWLEE